MILVPHQHVNHGGVDIAVGGEDGAVAHLEWGAVEANYPAAQTQGLPSVSIPKGFNSTVALFSKKAFSLLLAMIL